MDTNPYCFMGCKYLLPVYGLYFNFVYDIYCCAEAFNFSVR